MSQRRRKEVATIRIAILVEKSTFSILGPSCVSTGESLGSFFSAILARPVIESPTVWERQKRAVYRLLPRIRRAKRNNHRRKTPNLVENLATKIPLTDTEAN